MHTEKVPRTTPRKQEYLRSDSMRTIHLPPAEPARSLAAELKIALATDDCNKVQVASKALIDALSVGYNVKTPAVKVLSTRPRKVTESWVYETFGDYDPDTARIRLWMRTAVQKKPTSYGTFLSTLCHEFFHHLDMVSLNLPNTFHTRGFYERVGVLYHHVQNTPIRRIVWSQQSDGTFIVDWAATMRQHAPPSFTTGSSKLF